MLALDLIRKWGWEAIPFIAGLGPGLQANSNVFFVGSGLTNASDAADETHGQSWEYPLATLDYAIGKCTASKGDVILLAPGHAETLVAATSCVLDIAGVTVIGLGTGSLQPTFTLGTAIGATISVTAANCRIKNIKIISDLADITAGITASAAADGLVVEDCLLTDGAAAKELVIGVSLAAACDGCIIKNNRFFTVAAGDCASAIKLVGESVRTLIANNVILGDYSVAAIDGSTAASTLVSINDNIMQNIDATAGAIIKLHASTTGTVCRNLMQGGKSIADCFTGAAVMCIGNYGSGAAGAQGILEPAIDAD